MFIPSHHFCITGSTVFPDRVERATICIDTNTGLITEVRTPSPGTLSFGDDCLIYPGFLDTHVHAREDASGREVYKEDFNSMGRAALNGGVVHVAEMGNNPVPPIDDRTYRDKQDLSRASGVPVTLYAMIGPGTRPLSMPVPYKLCHARTTGANDIIFFRSRDEILKTVAGYRGQHVSHHCEDARILEESNGLGCHEDMRPPQAEVSAIEFALEITARFGLKSKICHCSVCEGIQKIHAARERGLPVTCEITPHHLFFDRGMITDENRPRMKMNPPLRTSEDRSFCIAALRSGEADMLASDHAPHTKEDQELRKVSGHPHLDTLGSFTTWLVQEQGFTPMDIARICSEVPAKFLLPFLPPSYGRGYGRILAGYVGSLTIINTTRPVTVCKDHLRTKCRWSPFEGITFPGSVVCTVVKGFVTKSILA